MLLGTNVNVSGDEPNSPGKIWAMCVPECAGGAVRWPSLIVMKPFVKRTPEEPNMRSTGWSTGALSKSMTVWAAAARGSKQATVRKLSDRRARRRGERRDTDEAVEASERNTAPSSSCSGFGASKYGHDHDSRARGRLRGDGGVSSTSPNTPV